MKKIQILLVLFSIFIVVQGVDVRAQEAKARWEMMNLIRKEKLEIVLPKAMRGNSIDMWIIVNRYGRNDPISRELGAGGASDKWYQGKFLAYTVFTDRGRDGIERKSMLEVEGALKKFVEERDPKRIAVNMSDNLGSADGLSHTCYLALVKALGDRYAKRLVSSEMLVSDFRSLRVTSEIAAFAKSIDLTGQLMGRALSNEVIEPGVTTLGDVAFWVADQLIALGYAPSYGHPRILYPKMPTDKDGHPIVKPPTGPYDRVIQRGDLIGWDGGIRLYGIYGTDIERYAYVLQEGETDVPETIKDLFKHGLNVRKICRDLVKPGRTGLETLHVMYDKLETLGYQPQPQEDNVTDSPNIEVNIGWHTVAEQQGHGSGPAIWIDSEQKFCSQLVLKATQLLAFEFMVYYPLPEWGGNKLRFDFEENVIITEDGVGLFIPTFDKITLVR